MKQVASRLASGTSLRDSSLVFQPVIDAHAVVPLGTTQHPAYQAADMAIDLFDDLRNPSGKHVLVASLHFIRMQPTGECLR